MSSEAEQEPIPFEQRLAAIKEAFMKADRSTKEAIRLAGSYDPESVAGDEFDAYDPGWGEFSNWSQFMR